MDVYVDLVNPKKGGFFISVSQGKESISFDYTTKGHRVVKQVLLKHTKTKEKPTLSWKTLRVLDGIPKGIHNVDWIDRGNIDIINGDVYKTVWEKPLPNKIKRDLLYMVEKIYKARGRLNSIRNILADLDTYLSMLMKKYK